MSDKVFKSMWLVLGSNGRIKALFEYRGDAEVFVSQHQDTNDRCFLQKSTVEVTVSL